MSHPHSSPALDQQRASELLHGLVAIPSLSTQEAAASKWLVEQMQQLGFDRAYVDTAGSAVGEIGSTSAARTLILLGHIDTVPGDIPVRIETGANGEQLLYGRGSVDAKGPLATFVAAAAQVGPQWAHENDLRVVVVGAVEEEAASSKGARMIRDRFNGVTEPLPIGCIIGEPSHWSRVTLGYKGRILIEIDASQPMAHTAGPDAGVATLAVDFWQWISNYAANYNTGKDKVFDQFSPSLRKLHTFTDAAMHDHVIAQAGIRLPLDFDVQHFVDTFLEWTAGKVQLTIDNYQLPIVNSETPSTLTLHGEPITLTCHFRSYEPAWRGDRNNALVRSFLAAIRESDPTVRPSFLSKSGTSDLNVVGPAWQCPILAYGPGDSTLDHTPHEHIDLGEYLRAITVLAQALRNLPELLAS